MTSREFCYSCMEETDFVNGSCSVCGYTSGDSWHPSYMKPGTDLHGRYLVGILIGANGEGANYIGFDDQLKRRVLIREFFPTGLCTRVKGKAQVGVAYNQLAEFKALMADFTELNRNLARYRSIDNLVTILDIFAENNTTYVVSEYVEGITLTEYLRDNAGELSWNETEELMPPILETIEKINSGGIIHRGLCPDTIYLTDDNRFCISGFSISSIRTKGAELKPEIFDGYAAPEQYTVEGRQGSWTDVYALCAILYRVLTGCRPIPAPDRIEKDNLSDVHDVNDACPNAISDIIMRGLDLNVEDRIQNCGTLLSLLDGSEKLRQVQPVPVIDEEESSEPEEEPAEEDVFDESPKGYSDDYSYSDDSRNVKEPKRNSGDKMKIPIIIAVVLLIILLLLVVLIFRSLNQSSSDDNTAEIETNQTSTSAIITTSDSSGNAEMPDLIGQDYETYEEWGKENDFFDLVASEEYNDDYAEGIIFWQEIDAGEMFETGSKIKVKVSKGSQKISLPSYSGKNYKDYESELDELSIPYQAQSMETWEVNSGNVVKLSVDDDAKYDRKENKTVIIYYAVAPQTEAPTPSPTEAPTEAPQDNQGQPQGGDQPVVADPNMAQ